MYNFTKFISIVLIVAFVILPFRLVVSQVMQGNAYRIMQDSINTGGGLSSSTNYSLEDTVGESAIGNSTSTNYEMRAGYQQMNETYLSLTAVNDVVLPAISGVTGGIGTSSSAWIVTTDNPAGYTLTIRASTSPAMKSISSNFSDYVTGGPDPDFNFTVISTSSFFGFSPEGSDIVQKYKDNGSLCNAGSSDTQYKCWDGFSVAPKTISEKNSANHPFGSTTTIQYRAESGSLHVQPSGLYSADIIVTAVTL